jgi:hypothetical protein
MRPLHVATALDTDAATRPDFARGYHVQTVIEAIYRSSEGAGWVSCDLSTRRCVRLARRRACWWRQVIAPRE